MPEQDIFGLPTTPPEENTEDFPWLSEEDPAVVGPPQAPAEEEEPPAEETPAAPEAEEEAPATEEQEEEPAQEEVRRWAGKYTSPEELEKGYRELRDLWRRTSERAKVYEQQNASILNKARELEHTLQQVMPMVQQATAQRQAPQYDEFGNPVTPPQPQLAPQQTQAYIDQMVAKRMQEMQGQMYQQANAAAERNAALRAVRDFYERHQIEENDDVDSALFETVTTLNDAWSDGDLDISNPDSLEIALEATNRPALRKVLELNPSYVDSDAGMELARFQASLLEGNAITQQTSAVPASQVGKSRKPAVERASGGSDSGTVNPAGDPWLEAVAEHRDKSPFKGTVFE